MNENFIRAITYFIKDPIKKAQRREELSSGLSDIKLIMTLLVKDEADIIEDNILFHKSVGVDGFIVTDNNSTDGTREILQKYKDNGTILEIIDEPNSVYYQAQWVDRMIRIAKEKFSATWIINADADEFWYPKNLNLKQDILYNKNSNILSAYLKNYVPINNVDNYLNETFFIQNHLPDFAMKKFDLDNGQFYQSKKTPKVIIKAKDYKKIEQGNHDCAMRNKKHCIVENIIVYHFFVRNYSHFENKVIKGGIAYSKHPDKNMGIHWRVWYQDYLDGKLLDSYNAIFNFDKLDLLQQLGVIGSDSSLKNYFEEFIWKNEKV